MQRTTQLSDEQVRNTIFNTHGIITLYQEKLTEDKRGLISMLFGVVQGLYSAIFSFLLIFSDLGKKMT